MNRNLIAALSVSVFLAGCFEQSAPKRDVTARSPSEAAEKRASVTFLDFSGCTGLTAFPGDLGSYPALTRLSVRGVKSAASVPASVADAKGLAELDLAATGLSALPDELARLSSLRRLYLSDNGLRALPPAVCAVKSLDYINLDRNALESLPDEIGNLTALKWVRLNGNRLEDLPASCANWKNVRRLYLRGNRLRALPAAVLEMENLEELDIGKNDIASLPEELCLLPKLHRIDVDGNPNLAVLPAAITNMPQLTHLFAYRCALSTNEQRRVRSAYPDKVRHFMSF